MNRDTACIFVPDRRGRARLHVNAGDPLHLAREPHAMGSAGKGGICCRSIPEVGLQGEISRDVVPELRRAGPQRVDSTDDMRQRPTFVEFSQSDIFPVGGWV